MNFKEKLENKKILVTGGAGFIGSNLVEKLLELGVVVTVLDNFATGHRHNIEPFFKNEKFTLIEGDIRDLETCKKACDGQDMSCTRQLLALFLVLSMTLSRVMM